MSQEIDAFFQEYVFGFMFNDIVRALNTGTNFLVALGLSVYTEAMCGLVTVHLRDPNWSRRNYEAFLPYLGHPYEKLHDQIDLYKRVRCGLVHEYFVKGQSIIAVRFIPRNAPGIVLEDDTMKLAVEFYFRDFKIGVRKYYNRLMSGDHELLLNFKQATR